MILPYDIGKEEGIKEGIQVGIQKGEKDLLLRMLTSKFGNIAHNYQIRIQDSSPSQLQLYIENILQAKTISDVFKDD